VSLLKIARIGHPVLAQPAVEVPAEGVGSADVQRLIEDMVQTMRESEGVGLAAPQVYAPHRIIIVEVPATATRVPPVAAVPLTILVNPLLIDHSADQVDDWEGCLSIPDLRGRVPRWRTVRVSALDRQGQPVTVDAEGFFARVIQHEVDHLDGVMFPERMTDLRTLTHVREFARFRAERAG
jgi:peptide deformylase